MRIIDDKALLVDAHSPDEITSRIKKSAEVEGGQIAVYWGLKEAQALTALGYENVPSPVRRDYVWCGRFPPFDHQRVTVEFLTLNPRSFLFSEQGVGKTAGCIWAADYLMKKKQVKRVLIVCPLSIMRSAWQRDLFQFAMHRSVSIAYGTAEQRRKVIREGCEFVVINYDGLEIVKKEVMESGFDLIVADECTFLKTATTKRWKVFHDIAKDVPYLWLLTGTPAAQSPLDAYGLAKLINPECPKVFSHFRDSVMMQVTRFKWVPKPHAQEVVHKLLQPAIRFEKKDCLDLPDVTFMERDAPLTAQQKKYYAKMKTDMLIEAAGEEVSAVNAAVKINKLLQISSGAVYSDGNETIEFDVSNRLNVVLEAIEESSHKVLIFVPFNHTIMLLKEFLEKNKVTCDVLNGAVSGQKRGVIVDRFQTKPDPRALIIQPQAAAHGLTLTEANTIIWYAPVTSVETYLQANARIDRPGQKNPMTIVHIKGSEVEDRLYAMLQGKVDTHNKLIDLYRQEMGV